MCILRDFPQHKNPRALCRGGSPNFIRSHVPIEIFPFYETGKKWGNKKRVVSVRGVLVHFPEVWEHPWVPLPWENALVWEPSLQLNGCIHLKENLFIINFFLTTFSLFHFFNVVVWFVLFWTFSNVKSSHLMHKCFIQRRIQFDEALIIWIWNKNFHLVQLEK